MVSTKLVQVDGIPGSKVGLLEGRIPKLDFRVSFDYMPKSYFEPL